MTPSQAAKVIGCSARHVRTLIGQGRLAARREIDGWEIDSKSVTRFTRLPVTGRGWPRGKPRKEV